MFKNSVSDLLGLISPKRDKLGYCFEKLFKICRNGVTGFDNLVKSLQKCLEICDDFPVIFNTPTKTIAQVLPSYLEVITTIIK